MLLASNRDGASIAKIFFMTNTLSKKNIDMSIFNIRGQRVILDTELAQIYGVTTKRLNEQVKRNLDRFPDDFMFQLNEEEEMNLRAQSSSNHGGRRTKYFAFTEHGALMLASVLNTPVAVAASIQVVRAFINLRKMLSSHQELAKKLDALERKYDYQFKVVFDAVRELTLVPESPRKIIGIKNDG